MTHFILVHGAGHGGWCWYKLQALLRLAGHRVTAPDLMASGADPNPLDSVRSLHDYVRPLMEIMASVDPHEKVVLVGHSLAGIALSLAMERYPEKISVAVFVIAVMHSVGTPPSTVIKEFFARLDDPMDCKFIFNGGPEKLPTSVMIGTRFMASKMYQLCESEVLSLATLLIRPSGYYEEDISKDNLISKENYGSVNRIYVVSKDDELMKEDFQRWIIKNNPAMEVMEIAGSDHMVMLSKPKELCHGLFEIAERYA